MQRHIECRDGLGVAPRRLVAPRELGLQLSETCQGDPLVAVGIDIIRDPNQTQVIQSNWLITTSRSGKLATSFNWPPIAEMNFLNVLT